MPFANINSSDEITLKLHFVETSKEKNNRPPIILLHGFTLDHRAWNGNVPILSNHYRVLNLDARGHGKSDAPQTGYGRGDRVNDLLGFMDALKIERAHIVGLSMGGTTALGLALTHQDRIASLTLVDSGAAGYNPSKKISMIDRIAKEKGLEAARKKWMDITLLWYRDSNREIKEQIATMMNEFSGATWLDEMRGKYPRTIDLDNVHKIKVPTKIFVGELDRIFVPLAKLLNQKIENSSLSIFAKVGHMLNMEAPERFNRELLEFLRSVDKDLPENPAD